MPTDVSILNTVKFLLPEAVLVLVGCIAALIGAGSSSGRLARAVALAGFAIAGVLLWMQWGQPAAEGLGVLLDDGLSRLGRGAAIVWGALFLLLASGDDHHAQPEYASAGTFGFVGMMIVSSAHDLVLLFAGLELVSIASYVLLGLAGRRRLGLEGALKYFILSIVSSAVLLYGLSFLYGLAGTTDMSGLAAWSTWREGWPLIATLGLVLVLGGLTFKMAAAPFHFYAADVYEATSFANAGLLAVLPKAVGVMALLRLALAAQWWRDPLAWQIFLALAMITMTLGNVCAVRQRNLRRMMGYSSVAHAGYLLIGVTVMVAALERGQDGVDGSWSVLFYVVAYGLASLGLMAGLVYLERCRTGLENVEDLSGLATAFPAVSAAVAICLFSLTGIPPLGGFLGKLYLLKGAVFQSLELPVDDSLRWWLIALAVVTVVNAAIAATYYLRIVGSLYFGTADSELVHPSSRAVGLSGWSAVVAGALVVWIGLLPGPLTRWTQSAALDLSAPNQPAVTVADTR